MGRDDIPEGGIPEGVGLDQIRNIEDKSESENDSEDEFTLDLDSEANEADVVEQRKVVPVEDDEYR